MGYVRDGCDFIRVRDLVKVLAGEDGGMDACLGESLGMNVRHVGDVINIGTKNETYVDRSIDDDDDDDDNGWCRRVRRIRGSARHIHRR